VNSTIALERLDNHRIARSTLRDPASVVTWLGAVQAQDYAAAKWGVALRMANVPGADDLERALAEGTVLRTHVLRPTWHFVPASDVWWMLDLSASRVEQSLAYAYRQFEIDAALRKRARKTFERAVEDGSALTRGELGGHLARAGIAAKGVRLALLTIHAELEGIVCSGPVRGKDITYALLAARAPKVKRLSRDEALAELTTRYFRSHGPATLRDFAWWSGLTMADVKRGVGFAACRHEVIDGLSYWRADDPSAGRAVPASTHLLPIYDEYLVAYRDLDAVPRKAGSRGRLEQAVVAGGHVVGTWKAVTRGTDVALEVTCRRRVTSSERRALDDVAARYGRFTGKAVSVRVEPGGSRRASA